MARAGYFFPHDEFYGASMRDVMAEIARRARPGAQVASESPILAAYYAERANRKDLIFVSLSDPAARKQLREGDFLIDERGRRYFSNDALLSSLRRSITPAFSTSLGGIHSADLYQLDTAALQILQKQ